MMPGQDANHVTSMNQHNPSQKPVGSREVALWVGYQHTDTTQDGFSSGWGPDDPVGLLRAGHPGQVPGVSCLPSLQSWGRLQMRCTSHLEIVQATHTHTHPDGRATLAG